MQVNIERLPQALFQKFSSDVNIKAAFLGTFFVAILTGSASLLPETTLAHRAIFALFWGPLIAVLLLLYAYRRALKLISPSEQLNVIEAIAIKQLLYWDRHATKGARRLKLLGNEEKPDNDFDIYRFQYFTINPHWLNATDNILRNTLAIADHYNLKGDSEISGRAFEVVVNLHQRYVQVKGATFVSNSTLIDNPHSYDTLLSDTLERLRQWSEELFLKNDERAFYQLHKVLAFLCRVYLEAKYSGSGSKSSHALLVTHYLDRILRKSCSTKMVDVIMDGQRLLSECGRSFIFAGHSEVIIGQIKGIKEAAILGIVSQEHMPATQTGSKCFGDIGVSLLSTTDKNTKYAVVELNRAHVDLIKLMLDSPAKQSFIGKDANLTPYFEVLPEFYIKAFNGELTRR